MRKIINNNIGSVVPPIIFIITIIGCGALYTLFFLVIGIPFIDTWLQIPASDAKTYIYMIIYALPVIIAGVGVAALLLAGLKREYPVQPGGL